MINHHLLISGLFAASFFAGSLSAGAQKQCQRRNVQYQAEQRQSSVTVYELWYVDEEPYFPGGERGLLRYINSERRYPEAAYDSGISGRVLCSFTIDRDGSVSDVKVIRGVESSLDQEAVRIIANMPRWRPAKVSDSAVSVSYVLPIPFRL